MSFPMLYGNVSRGDKIKVWNICVTYDETNKIAKIVRTYGQLDGKQTHSEKEITKGKNIGKKNETTVYSQACFEAQSLWNKQKEQGYVENIDELRETTMYLPMLAHDFTKRGKSINLGTAFVQPKIDGVRLLVTPEQKISRTGKQVDVLQHLDVELSTLFTIIGKDIALDGELFTFDLPFEEISGCFRQSKKVDYEKIQKLQFYIFDCFSKTDNSLTFESRYLKLENTFKQHKFSLLQLVHTAKVKDKSVDELHEKFISQGYEGIMIRNANGLYKCNFRSVDLQKYKTFVDDEYLIIDVKEATGNDKGTAIFVCKDKSNDTTFAVRPRGSREVRTEYLKNSKKYINKQLTVRYQNLSEYNIPRFPVGIAIRDYE